MCEYSRQDQEIIAADFIAGCITTWDLFLSQIKYPVYQRKSHSQWRVSSKCQNEEGVRQAMMFVDHDSQDILDFSMGDNQQRGLGPKKQCRKTKTVLWNVNKNLIYCNSIK
jgi:hypothetical protein